MKRAIKTNLKSTDSPRKKVGIKSHIHNRKKEPVEGYVAEAKYKNNQVQKKTPQVKRDKSWMIFMALGGVGIIGGLVCILIALLQEEQEIVALEFPMIPSQTIMPATYSNLTGEPLADGADQHAPAYCVQTPNGTDGARPQAGLTQAGVIFEAIAEAGITRFAAIYQNPTSAIIGPIRSLRIYYLDWDTPFDCTIVHAGGSGDALSAVASGGYKDLSEDYSYMYRGTYRQRLWNNLFTTSDDLKRFSDDHNYRESNIQGFARMTPEESVRSMTDDLVAEKLDITSPAKENTSSLATKVGTINLNFGGYPNFNVSYAYDANTNAYLRSYQNGNKHEVYSCPNENLGDKNPEDVCTLTQMAPNVVIAMVVNERRASDNYHEDITTSGSGKAYVFQNGSVVEGTWNKSNKNEQIKFLDNNGNEIKLAPGQTFISAIPSYGSIAY